MHRWLCLVTLLIGCATPYQPKGLGGGYEDYAVNASPGVHFVSFEGNIATDDAAVYRHWRQRVVELCGDEWQLVSSRARRRVVPVRRPRVEGFVRCGPPDPVDLSVSPR